MILLVSVAVRQIKSIFCASLSAVHMEVDSKIFFIKLNLSFYLKCLISCIGIVVDEMKS